MSTLICNATGNLTGSSTFAAAETGTGALNLVRNSAGSSFPAANTTTSSSFTVTNGKVIDAVLLWVSSAAAPNGTFKVDLQKGGVSQGSVTVNKSDLPDSTNLTPVPVLFKLGSTATGDGGSNWTIVVVTTGTTQVPYYRASATGSDFTRALRTTTAATPVAADDLYIVGELTGAGTHTSRTVTMDSTATTAYGNGTVNSTAANGGGIRVSNYGTLSYGTSASTNYVLRINGDLEVYQFGTLNIGSSGSEIPRTSTAVLEFQQVSASGDFGLIGRNSSTINIAGLSRTSGKNIVQCKLTADVASSSVLTSTSSSGLTSNTSTGLEPSGNSLLSNNPVENGLTSTHGVVFSGPSITNTTQTATVWLARGSGTNNRFVRLTVGNNSVQTSVTNGFFSDIDLQAGTAGTVTAVGNGTATSVSITPLGAGYLIRMTGKVSSGAATPSVLINSCSAAGTTSYAGSSTSTFILDRVALVTAASISDTTYNVDTDTGWLSGDAIIIASTSRTAAECEIAPLNANAGASSMVSGLYPFGNSTVFAATHSGTSPTQAEIGLLTRNVKIRSTSTTLWSYLFFEPLAVATLSWADLYYLGANSTNKHGVEVADSAATAGAKSITYCAIHEVHTSLYLAVGNNHSLNITFSNNVVWNTTNLNGAIFFSSWISAADWTFASNLIIRSGGHGINFADITGTLTNNTVANCTGTGGGYIITTAVVQTLGNWSGNVSHSNNQYGYYLNASNVGGTIDSLVSWRNGSYGFYFIPSSGQTNELVINSPTIFGNSGTYNMLVGTTDWLRITGTGIIAGDAAFSVQYGIYSTGNMTLNYDLSGIDFSGTGTGLAAHTTAEFYFFTSASATGHCPRGTVNNCKFGAPNILNSKSLWGKLAYLAFEKYNRTAGDHRVEMTYGQLKTDTTFYNTASPSMRMTPNSASNKLESAPKGRGILVPVANGNTAAVQVAIYKSKTGDGAAYNGNQPRLVQRANPALGQNSDVVLGTYSSGTGSWNVLSANTSTATDDGAFEIVVDCDGTAGWINVDDWQVA
jgi:hypothetical protein